MQALYFDTPAAEPDPLLGAVAAEHAATTPLSSRQARAVDAGRAVTFIRLALLEGKGPFL